MERLYAMIGDQPERLFVIGVTTAFILAIALLVILFVSRIAVLRNRLLDAKEIDEGKNQKIADLEREMAEVREKDAALERELEAFESTKASLQSKKELLFTMQERMDLLEEKEREQTTTIDACSQEYQTLAFKYKSLQKRNEFLVEENTRLRTETTKMLMKVREQERRIFEKLMSLKGDGQALREEAEKLAASIVEKNGELFDALRHDALFAEILPMNEAMLTYQKEVIATLRKNLGREGAMRDDIAERITSRQELEEHIGTMVEKLREEKQGANAASSVAAYLLKRFDADRYDWLKSETKPMGEERTEQLTQIRITLPDGGRILVDTSFATLACEEYLKTFDGAEKERLLTACLEDFKKHIEALRKPLEEKERIWVLLPSSSIREPLCRQEGYPCRQTAGEAVELIDAVSLMAILEAAKLLWDYRKHYQLATKLLEKAEVIQERFTLYASEVSKASEQLEMIQESFPLGEQNQKRSH
jgi:DNA anti-recombination protein RmuC